MKLACFTLLLPMFACAADLTGVIVDEGGSPVQGATVMLPTAGVREGTSPLCPSCYPDCSKMAATGADGKFVIKDVDDALLFHVLAAAPGYRPACVRGFDPRKGEARIQISRPKSSEPAIRGKVVDPEGRPVFGALVEAAGYEKQSEGKRFGGFPGDDVAVSDRDGVFELAAGSREIRRASVIVRAPQLARAMFGPIPVGGEPVECRLDRGVTVRGRLVHDGRPVARARIEIMQKDRNCETFLGLQSIGTDIDGKFELTNVPAGQFLQLSVCRDTLPDGAVGGTVPVATAGPDTEVDLGDVPVEKGVLVEGLVTLTDGNPVPPNTRVLISRKNAWDPQTRVLDQEGRFQLTARVGDELSFYARVKGYVDAAKGEGGYANEPDLKVSDESRRVRVVMEPKTAGAVAGTVLTSGGEPAKGAKIHAFPRFGGFIVENGRVLNSSRGEESAVTDDAGKYQLERPADDESNLLLVLHESGWAKVRRAENPEIRLTPWSRVEGTARVGSEIPKGRVVKLSFPIHAARNEAYVFFQNRAEVDAEGRFVMDCAAGGVGRIGVLNGKKDTEEYFQVIGVEIAKGETTRVDLGGVGATVRGRIAIPEEIRKRVKIGDAAGSLRLRQDAPMANSETLEPEKQSLGEREMNFGLSEDGSFEIEDVRPGAYSLSVMFLEPDAKMPFLGEFAGFAGAAVQVGEGNRDVQVEDFDVRVTPPSLRPGDHLPKFTATTKAGTLVSDDSLKGKLSILIFAEGGDDRDLVEALRLLPADSAPITLFVNPAGVVTEAAASSLVSGADAIALAKAFGVQNWPSYYVVSKEGVVQSCERHADDAIRVFGKALSGGR